MEAEVNRDTHVPAHKDFREKYFQGFKKDSISIPSSQALETPATIVS
jgi:tRNA (guanine10-N2)-methyltransferase